MTAQTQHDLYSSVIPTRCPVCGAFSMAPDSDQSALLAVCDVLVIKALEHLGRFIVRADRSRYRILGTHPFYVAHTFWPASDLLVNKALKGAWDVIPALLESYGCCGVTAVQVTRLLDSYVHDLAITGTDHCLDQLMYRFTNELGLPVYLRVVEDGD